MVFVYMPNRGEALLFGGQGAGNVSLGDMWIWKAGCWSLRRPAQSPEPRYSAAAAYDPVHSYVVVYGGRGNAWTKPASGIPRPNSDTWTWNGEAWSRVSNGCPCLDAASVAGFDPATRRVLLFGADGGSSATLAWDGRHWQSLHPETNPSRRAGASMAIDPVSNQLLLVGGSTCNYDIMCASATDFSWNGSTWVDLKSTHPRGAEFGIAPWAAGRVVVTPSGWAWNGTDWIQMRVPSADVHDVGTSRSGSTGIDTGPQVLFFGGLSESGLEKHYYGDFLVWDGRGWTESTSGLLTTRPPPSATPAPDPALLTTNSCSGSLPPSPARDLHYFTARIATSWSDTGDYGRTETLLLQLTAPLAYDNAPTTIQFHSMLGPVHDMPAGSSAREIAATDAAEIDVNSLSPYATASSVADCSVGGDPAAAFGYSDGGEIGYRLYVVHKDFLFEILLYGNGGVAESSLRDAKGMIGSIKWIV